MRSRFYSSGCQNYSCVGSAKYTVRPFVCPLRCFALPKFVDGASHVPVVTMKAIDPRMPTATELAFMLNVGAVRHSVGRWPALHHRLAIARARGEHRLTQPTCLLVIAALRGRGRQIAHGDVAGRIFQQAQPRCARRARGSRARPRAPAGWVPTDSRKSGTNCRSQDRKATLGRARSSSPFAPRKDFCVPFCGFAALREVLKDRTTDTSEQKDAKIAKKPKTGNDFRRFQYMFQRRPQREVVRADRQPKTKSDPAKPPPRSPHDTAKPPRVGWDGAVTPRSTCRRADSPTSTRNVAKCQHTRRKLDTSTATV